VGETARETRPEDEHRAKGSHFLVEGGLGMAASQGSEAMAYLLFGGGGKVFSTPVRLYAFGEAARITLAGARHTDGAASAVVLTDLSLGVRAYMPVVGPLRVFADAAVGQSRSEASPASPGERAANMDGCGALSVGAQLRFLPELSVGGRVRHAFYDFSLPRGAHGVTATLVSLTGHF
jgi:hypothetical protein